MDVKPTGKTQAVFGDNKGRNGNLRTDGADFANTLRDSEQERKRQACTALLQRIDQLSEELKKKPTPDGIHQYRAAVTEFMKEAMDQSYHLDQHTHWDQEGNRKSMVIVKKVNDSLAELMDMVVQGKGTQIKLVAKLDQIRGLLLDLFV